MRTPFSILVASCLTLAACSGGSDEASPSTDPATSPTAVDSTSGLPDRSSVENTTDTAEVPETTETLPEREVVPLPGLLDPSDEPIGNDADVRTGVLDNGLTYYVRGNGSPGLRASLRLAVRAGSSDELGESSGLAHFLEHMLFNGTAEYPENELVDTLRGWGASFGADINAYTSYDETVYRLTVPNDDETVQRGLDVLAEWLSNATIDPDQVELERGIVLDEWRTSNQTVNGRLFEVAQDLYLPGTPYEGRAPIGTDEHIRTMPAEEIRAYYDAWYRPDNAAVVVVGDVDPDAAEQWVRDLFADAAPRTESIPERADKSFGLKDVPAFALHADPDQQSVDVEVTLPLPAMESVGTAGLRASLLDQMAYDALVRRLQRDRASGDAPFTDILPGSNDFVETIDAPALYAFSDVDGASATLRALLDEYERAYRFGFTADEIDLAREAVRAEYDTRYDGRNTTRDDTYATEYVQNFLTGTPFPSVVDEYDLVTGMLDALTADDVALRFNARWTNSAPHVIISTPESLADQMPSRDDVLAAVAATYTADLVERGVARELPDALMEAPDGVAPSSTDDVFVDGDGRYSRGVLTFPNGARVIVAPNDNVDGTFNLRAMSPGGSSLVEIGDVADALYAADLVTASGVADFNSAEVDEILAGRDVEVGAWIEPYFDNMYATGASVDLEVVFQLMHLYMAEPRFDEVALDQLLRTDRPVVEDPSTDPNLSRYDALADVRYDNELRFTLLPTLEDFDTVDLAGIERVWRSRFGDASDWTFVIAGDVEPADVLLFAGSYIGTLPGGAGDPPSPNLTPAPPAGIAAAVVNAGQGETATVTMLFTTPIDDVTPDLRATTDIAVELVQARLTDIIREEFGESYSPSIWSEVTTDPDPVIEINIEVSAAPDRIDAVAALVIEELNDLTRNGPPAGELSNAVAGIEAYYGWKDSWNVIDGILNDELRPTMELDDYVLTIPDFAAFVPSSTEMQTYLAEFLPTDRYVQVASVPR